MKHEPTAEQKHVSAQAKVKVDINSKVVAARRKQIFLHEKMGLQFHIEMHTGIPLDQHKAYGFRWDAQPPKERFHRMSRENKMSKTCYNVLVTKDGEHMPFPIVRIPVDPEKEE